MDSPRPPGVDQAPPAGKGVPFQRYDRLHRWILSPQNLDLAFQNVLRKGGAPGVDGMFPNSLGPWLKAHHEEFAESIRAAAWTPAPLRKGRHLLLVPAVADRLVHQAFLQVLLPIFEQDFSSFAFGCRPQRSRDLENILSRRYRREGCTLALRIFIDNFIDEVDHGILLRQMGKRIKDEGLLTMTGRILKNVLVLEDRRIPLTRGIRQCGSLSFLLGTLHLSGCDRDLEDAGLRFTRFGDRYTVYVKSRAEAEAVLDRMAAYLERKLCLRLNRERSVVEE